MRSYNRIFLIGNCAAEPILAETKKGKGYLYFPMAIERDYSNEKDKKEVDFHRIVIWGDHSQKLNDLINKGTRLFVTGKLANHKYENQDQTKYVTEVHSDQVEILSFKKNEEIPTA